MSTAHKLNPAVEEETQEKKIDATGQEDPSLYVVENQAEKRKEDKPQKECPPFYADLNFYIRVAMVILLIIIVLWVKSVVTSG